MEQFKAKEIEEEIIKVIKVVMYDKSMDVMRTNEEETKEYELREG